jgi:MFS family permease
VALCGVRRHRAVRDARRARTAHRARARPPGARARARRRLGGAAITAASVALLAAGWLVIGTAGTTPLVVAGLLVGGTGVGLAVPNLNLRLTELAPPEGRGRVLSGLVASVFLGQFLSPLAAQPLIEVSGIAGAFTLTGLVAFAGVLAAAVTIRRSHRGKEIR